MQETLAEAIHRHEIVLVVMDKGSYHSILRDLFKILQSTAGRTCLVALNRPYASLKSYMQDEEIDSSSFLFIDTLTPAVDLAPDCDDCIPVEDPHALTELSLAMTRALEEKGCESILFDSISTLVVYHPGNVVLMFAHNAINKLLAKGKKGILLAVEEDANTALIKDLTMFSDVLLEFGKQV